MAEKEKMPDNRREMPFMDLEELVYAPVRAVADANFQLNAALTEQLGALAVPAENGKDGAMRLKTIEWVYKQLRRDGDGSVLEEIGLDVPLLSLIQPSGLQVTKSNIRFAAEVRKKRGQAGKSGALEGRACPDKKDPELSLPRIRFDIELGCAGVPEGLARFTDVLNRSMVPETLSETYDDEGVNQPEKQELRSRKARLRKVVRKMEQLIGETKQRFNEQAGDSGKTYEMFVQGSEKLIKGSKLEALHQKICHQEKMLTKLQQMVFDIACSEVQLELDGLGVTVDEG